MELERYKNLEVFFCGTVQLFAHFILCYRGMSLTIVDFLLCLELYIKSVLGDELFQITANLVLVWLDKLWCLCHLVHEYRPTFLWACLLSRHCCSLFNCSIFLSILLSSLCSPLLSVSFTPSILLLYLLFTWPACRSLSSSGNSLSWWLTRNVAWPVYRSRTQCD